MKKIIVLLLLLSAVLTAGAQDGYRIIDRNVTFSGPLLAICKSKEISNKTAISYGDATFYIKNDRLNESNFVSFWIETADGHLHEYNSWKDNDVKIEMFKDDRGMNVYIIYDDTFRYLGAVEMDNGKYAIQLFTALRE